MYIITYLFIAIPLLWDPILAEHGYKQEEHKVTTDDGYIIRLHRILSKKNNPSPNVVVFVHGLFASSRSWRLKGPKESLPFLLADNGHDSWMVDLRLNGQSMDVAPNATGLAATEKWNFSMDELGTYDITAAIDYILKITKKEQVTYIGHSLACFLFIIMGLTKPEYQAKVNTFVGLAPFFNMKEISTVMQMAKFTYLFGMMDLFNFDMGGAMSDFVCLTYVCNTGKGFMANFKGDGSEYSQEYSSESSKVVYHVVQGFNQEDMRMYDYGWFINFKKYGYFTPPIYNLNKVNASRIEIFYGGEDLIILPKAVENGIKKLRNVQGVHYYPSYGHKDFMQGNTVFEDIYLKIVDILKPLT